MVSSKPMSLDDWIRQQYGPGRRYASARALALAITNGRHPNMVAIIHERGVAKLETLYALADACDVDRIYVLGLAAGLDMDQPGDRIASTEEAELLRAFRLLDQRARAFVLGGCTSVAYGWTANHPTSRDD